MRADEIRELVELVEKSGIAELEVRRGRNSIRISKLLSPGNPGAAAVTALPVAAAAAAVPAADSVSAPPVETAPPEEEGLIQIRSPMVGTFYTAASPTSPAFANPGSRISVGQVVCIVEAMKLMNEIESEVAGSVVRALVENGQPVEFNQPLFLIKPD